MVNCLFDVGFLQILCSCGYHRCNIRCVYIYLFIYLLIDLFIYYLYYIHSCLVHARDRSKCWHCLCSDLQVKPTDSCGIFASCSFFGALRCWTFACRRSKQIRQPISTNRISSIVYHWNSLSTISSFMFLPCVQSSVNPSVISLAIVGSPCRPGESGCAWVMLGFDTALHMSRHVTTFSW